MSSERRAAVLGSPVAHSLSPVLHNAAYAALGLPWTYDRIDCDDAGLAPLVRDLDPSWVGLSVTMPGKAAALNFADRATDRATLVGAANTLVRKDFGWLADCTDVAGVTGALGGEPARTAVVLGAGGTARAAIAGLAALGVTDLALVVRDPARSSEARATAARAGVADVAVHTWTDTDFAAVCERADVVVSTVPPVATEPVADEVALARRVLDVLYHPWPTPLADAVARRGGELATGLDMLLHQAFGQIELFTGMPAPREQMRDALLAATGNVVPLRLRRTYAPKVIIDDYDPAWPSWYEQDHAAIADALGGSILLLEHVGSTSVPGTAAKPIVDILLVVADASDEGAYLPALTERGYKLRLREPEHRMLVKRVIEGDHHNVNLHVHTAGTAEITRLIEFRDWLRRNDSDRDLYVATKRELAEKHLETYPEAKTDVIEEIKARYGG